MIRSNAIVSEPDSALVLLRLLFIAFAAFVMLRIGLNALILNQFMNYTTLEGSTIEKINPAFYGIALIAAALMLGYRIELSALDLGILRAIIIFIGGIAALLAMLAISGLNTSAGYIIDTYVTACMAAFIMMAMPQAYRSQLAALIIFFLVVCAGVAIAEFALKVRFLPYPGGESVFRPTGLSDHPLQLGRWCVMGITFMGVVRWPPSIRLAAIAVLFVGCLASGARIATMAAGLACLVVLSAGPLGGRSRADILQRKLMVLILSIVIVAGIIAGMFMIGALDRFEGGLADQSALARVNIYGVFDYLTWHEILFGTDILHVQRIANDVFGIPYIESSFVVFTVQFGLIGAIVFAALLANLFRALLKRRSAIMVFATLTFFVLALSNNGLSVKSPDILMIMLLIMCDPGSRSRHIAR
jgi:hypothetical protein